MATEDGLSRFDAAEFRTFRHDPSDSTSLSHNVVHFIQEEEATGNLWIGTVSGINYFDRSLERFKVFKANNPPGTVYTNATLDKKRQRLWLACTVAGLRYIDLSKQVIVDYKSPELDHETVWNVQLAGDSLLIATLRGVKILNLQNQHVYPFYTGSPVRSLLVDKNDLWFGTEGHGLGRFDRVTKNTIYYNRENGGTNNNDIWSLAIDKDHNLWIGTDGGGLNVLMRGTKISRCYVRSEFNDRSLSYNTIRSIFIEPNGGVWLGTYNGGVNYHENKPIQFRLYREDIFNEHSLRNNTVSAFAEAKDGTIWVGTDGGGLHYLKDGIVHRYSLPAKLAGVNVITALQSDGQGLWVGSFQNGLIYLDGHGGSKQFKHKPGDRTSVAANTVWAIQKDSLGYLWIGTNRGVNRFDPKTETFHHIDHPLNGNIDKLFKDIQAQTILISSDHTMWVGSYGLLMAYLPASDSVIEVKGQDEKIRSLPDLRVKTLLEDDGKIWIGTYGSGLCQYNIATHSLHVLDERDGLPDNIVLAVEKGEPGSLWLSTNKGLVHFKEADTIFTVFDANYGVQGTTFNRNAALRTSDGRLLFGGTHGFNIFTPRAITDNHSSLEVVFTDFSIFNKQVKPGSDLLKQSITETQKLDLPHTDSRLLTFHFSAFNFSSPDKIIYAYKLEGFNDDWQKVGNDHSVTFTNLDPKSYTLTVRASFNGKVWGPEKSLTIHIQTPWWRTAYFRWSVLLLFVIGAYSFNRYRIYELSRRKKELEHLVNLQGQEIKNQNHDLAAQNEELIAQNDEMAAQQQMITEQNIQLSEAKQRLQTINQSLEEVVGQRTEKLNETILQLNKTIKELDAFVYSASHDLIAPMKSVTGLIELARRQNQNPEVSILIDHMERSVKKLEDVVLNMIQYSQNSNLEVSYEPVNVYDLIQESIADLKFYPGMEAMNFAIDFNKDASVMIDRKRLKIILNNLIGNAIKYRDDRKESNTGQITFENGKTIWKLEIQDNGIGIDKHYLCRVFEMFFRATDRSQGSGLGLYIVKETVEKLYGEIYVDSEKGKWTKFTIAIPHENIYVRKK
ncbi:sensor histidine kinase [Chryseolinea lacunae]|uniref:histidine kinase n=1 Tax=Chryseolinea lacunae TaxID=2801331 RepID=A0ABS1L2E2_9BACT|nr:sensor histidine kinase [Chryseolinea lacunae]MBL0745878.1 hypothetical protein [Chryseolinea lacunae]